MRIAFAGSGPLGCPTLEALIGGHRHLLVGVITQPDRPKGRRLRVSPCAVRAFVQDTRIPVLTPLNVNSAESLQQIRALAPDLVLVAAYGQILKPELLELPAGGCINLHASLLPAHRGAAPIQWAIANGELETGATVMYMNERMDAGDIIAQLPVPIDEDDTAGSLHDKLARAASPLVLDAIDAIEQGTAARLPQDEARATYARKLKKTDGKIEWTRPGRDLYNHVRGFYPWPCCFCRCPGVKGGHGLLKILRARAEPGVGRPGTVLSVDETGPLVATADGALRLLEVQPEGKRAMSGGNFLHGHRLSMGDVLE